MTLEGCQLNIGDRLPEFRIIKQDLSEINTSNTSGKRIFLTVPSLDTDVCSLEIAKFMEFMQQYSDVLCYSISMDLPFALERWCQAKNNRQIITTSDYKYHEFAKSTGTYIKELGLLTRAAFVVDEYNIIQYAEYVKEITHEPNYNAILKAIQGLN